MIKNSLPGYGRRTYFENLRKSISCGELGRNHSKYKTKYVERESYVKRFRS